MNKEDIKALVIGVIEQYNTNNPFMLAEQIGLMILYHPLPNTLDAYRLNNLIVINKFLPKRKRKWVLAHEIGHYFIHGSESTLGNYLKNNLLIKPKMEKEADIFASEFLLADIDKYTLEGLTAEQLSALLNVPTKYIEYKWGDNNDYSCL